MPVVRQGRTLAVNLQTHAANKERIEMLQEDLLKARNSLEPQIPGHQDHSPLLNYRFAYPEFLPDPNPLYRNRLKEKLERQDMLARRSNVEIPEFYVGSVVAVLHSDKHAPGKTNRFLGICIQRSRCGLKAAFILRNVIDNLGVEVEFDLYDPTIQRIEVIRYDKHQYLLFLHAIKEINNTIIYNISSVNIEITNFLFV